MGRCICKWHVCISIGPPHTPWFKISGYLCYYVYEQSYSFHQSDSILMYMFPVIVNSLCDGTQFEREKCGEIKMRTRKQHWNT